MDIFLCGVLMGAGLFVGVAGAQVICKGIKMVFNHFVARG